MLFPRNVSFLAGGLALVLLLPGSSLGGEKEDQQLWGSLVKIVNGMKQNKKSKKWVETDSSLTGAEAVAKGF